MTAMVGSGGSVLAALAAFRDRFKSHLLSNKNHGCVSGTGIGVNVTVCWPKDRPADEGPSPSIPHSGTS